MPGIPRRGIYLSNENVEVMIEIRSIDGGRDLGESREKTARELAGAV